MKPGIDLKKYSKYFTESAFQKKFAKLSGKIGGKLLFYLIVLYELMRDKNIPLRNRLIFIAALGYFILPTDLISDFLPGLGFTDDLAFITYAMTSATDYITPEVREKAKMKVDQLLYRNNDLSTTEST